MNKNKRKTKKTKNKKGHARSVIALATVLLAVAVALVILNPFALSPPNISEKANVSLTPTIVPTDTLTVGSMFQLTVHVDNISNLWAWKVSLAWNASVLHMNGAPTEGPFLKNKYTTVFPPSVPDNNAGVLVEQDCAVFGSDSVSGSGDLATLTFKVVGRGFSSINMTTTMMQWGTADQHVQIPCTTSNATFNL